MNKFKEILEKLDPEKTMLTDDTREELVSMLEAKMTAIREEAYVKASDKANEKIKQLDESHATRMETLVENVKAKYEDKIVTMTEAHTAQINEKIEEIDTDHCQKVQTLVDSMDENFTSKFKHALTLMDEDHTSKLDKLAKMFKEQHVTDKMADIVDGFLNTYLEDVMPEAEQADKAKLVRLEQFYNSLTELVMVNSDYIQKEIKEAVIDAKSQLDAKDKEINSLMFEQIELNKKIDKKEATQLLESKSNDLSPALRAYVTTRFEDSTKEEIEENFQEAITAFKKEEANKRTTLIREAASKKKIVNPKIITEDETIINEPENDEFSGYIKVLEKAK